MTYPRQLFSLLTMNLSSIAQRAAPVITIIIGVACAVGVLVSMLAMGTGARRQELGNVREDRVVLSTMGTRSGDGNISRQEAAAILSKPGIRRGPSGEPIVVWESLVFIEGRRHITGNRIYFPLVGVTPSVIDYLPEVHFTEGRMFRPGLRELIVSNPCARQFTGFGLGDHRLIHGADWNIVGHFEQGDTQQCLVYADVDGIMSAFNRNTYSTVTVRLQSPQDFPAFREAVKSDPSLRLEVWHERETVEEAFKQLNSLLDFASYFVGTIMAVAATLGAVNSLYAIVDSRRRELATLRAIGFGSGVIAASILTESMLLAMPGALLGCGLAWLFFNGLSASPFGYSFQLAVTPNLAVLGIAWSLGMGILGGLFPALRASRLSVSTALRAM